MDATTPSDIERLAEARLRQAIQSFDFSAEEFEFQLGRVRDLDLSVADTEMRKAILRFREAFSALVKERQHFDAQINGKTGVLGAEPIDLAAARSEVGRLLDCLRADRNSGGISRQPEP